MFHEKNNHPQISFCAMTQKCTSVNTCLFDHINTDNDPRHTSSTSSCLFMSFSDWFALKDANVSAYTGCITRDSSHPLFCFITLPHLLHTSKLRHLLLQIYNNPAYGDNKQTNWLHIEVWDSKEWHWIALCAWPTFLVLFLKRALLQKKKAWAEYK